MKRWFAGISLVMIALAAWPVSAWAACAGSVSCSTSYGITENELGGIGDFSSHSSNYSFVPGTDDGGSTLGDTFVGNSSSTNYQTNSGFNTTAQPYLGFTVDTSSVNFGNVSLATKTTATATFHVTDYTSYGYAVSVIGTPPKNGSRTLTALTTDSAYNASVEQFGINTVHNTVSAVGADPLQNPAGFGFGVAGDGITGTYGTTRPYTIPDKWRFNSGETIASAPKTSGNTDYTMTLMMNAIATTAGGQYTGSLTLVATGTY